MLKILSPLNLKRIGLSLLILSLQPGISAQLKIDPQNIDIVRDSFGVPHIFAKTDAEAAYGLAWATLEDDTENAQFMLYALKGYLGRDQGVSGAAIDFGVQMMRVRERVEAEYEDIPEDFKRVLEGGCAGYNAYASTHKEELRFPKAFPITPQDIVVGHMLAQGLMTGLDGALNSIVNGSIVNQLPPERELGIGSNAYAVGPERSTDGNTYLAVNAHQPLEGLLSWYEVAIHSEEGWNVIGANFHGGLSIYHGTNEYLGWAHTTGHLDTKDIYLLEMHPRKKNFYKVDGEYKKLKTYRAKLKIGLGKKKNFVIPIRKKYWESIYGPTLRTKHGTYALRMPSMMDTKPAEQWWRMNKARNFEEFYRALRIQGLAQMNITYADREGNIFLLANGLVPKRAPGYDWKKVLPGNRSETLWTEYIPVEELAQFKNPSAGYVFNTNNGSFEGSAPELDLNPNNYDPNIGYKEKVNNRSLRSHELFAQYDKISYQDFKDIKYDITYPDSMVFLRDFPIEGIFELEPKDYPDIADALERIRAFDGTADVDDRNFPIFLFALYDIHRGSGGEKEQLFCTNKEECQKFFVEKIRAAKAHMLKHFGTLDVPLGEVQVHARAEVELPLDGGPDLIRAIYTKPYKDGKLRPYVGDSYIELIQYTPEGPIIESVSAYGASSKPGSPHYTDQMELFVNKKHKRMYLDKETVYEKALRIYHPE